MVDIRVLLPVTMVVVGVGFWKQMIPYTSGNSKNFDDVRNLESQNIPLQKPEEEDEKSLDFRTHNLIVGTLRKPVELGKAH